MNNSLGKKDSGIYRTGDVILVNSALGSPGTGWMSINSTAQVDSQSRLGKLLGSPVKFWNTQAANFGASTIFSVAYGNGVWVAGGAGGALRTSTNDGVTWNTQTSNFTTTICSVAYGNGVWVAGGLGGTLRTSTDAVTWNTQTSNTTATIFSVAYDNGIWVAGGSGGTLRTSTERVFNITASTTVGGYTWWIKT